MITLTARSTKPSIVKGINKELNTLSDLLENQINLSDQIFVFIKKYSRTIELHPDLKRVSEISTYIASCSDQLLKVNFNINNIEQLKNNVTILKSSVEEINDQLVTDINKYNDKSNKILTKLKSNTLEIEKFINSTSTLDLSDVTDEYITSNSAPKTIDAVLGVQDKINAELKNNIFVENTLLISDIQEKIILPYKLNILKKTLMENSDKYESIQDVIDKKYTLSNKYYKNAVISRFKEAYKLVVEREHGPINEALSLAFEVALNSNIHPAIITACKNLNEFDVYLACLEYDELEDFRFFKIKYEALPTLSSRFKNLINFNNKDVENNTKQF